MSIKQHLKYRFDNFMTQNPASQITGVFILVILIILLTSLFTMAFINNNSLQNDIDSNFLSRIWWSFMRVIDPGTITNRSLSVAAEKYLFQNSFK